MEGSNERLILIPFVCTLKSLVELMGLISGMLVTPFLHGLEVNDVEVQPHSSNNTISLGLQPG